MKSPQNEEGERWSVEKFRSRNEISLPAFKFDPSRVPNEKLAEIARIYYASGAKKKAADEKKKGPEPISEILPHVMLKIANLYKQRTN